jgi:2-aminoadipate transaminase
MIDAIAKFLPHDAHCTKPDGGMFLWVTLPPQLSAIDLFNRSIETGVAFVPGAAFHASGGGENTMRLNFSNCDEQKIIEGIRRIGASIESMLD